MKVLVADDELMFLDAMCTTLVRRGLEVVGYSTSLEGLVDLVLERQPDVCLLDVDFGGRSAVATAAAIRAERPGTPVVLLTGAATAAVWDAFQDGSVQGLVNKLCDISVVVRAVRRVGHGERVVERFRRPTITSRATALDRVDLSQRERAVVDLLCRGVPTTVIAEELGISVHTARTHVQNVLRKLEVSTRAKAVRKVLELQAAGADG